MMKKKLVFWLYVAHQKKKKPFYFKILRMDFMNTCDTLHILLYSPNSGLQLIRLKVFNGKDHRFTLPIWPNIPLILLLSLLCAEI